MAIDFSQVKEITIPQGNVKQLSINGVVVWSSKVLVSITLSGQTTSLDRGDSFSFGGTVTAHYSDGSTADVTSATSFSGYNMSTAGEYTVSASYTEDGVTVTATYALSVVAKWSTSWTSTYIYAVQVNGDAFTRTAANASAGNGNAIGSMYIAYKVDNEGTAPAIWTSNGNRTGFTTSTYGKKVRIAILLPGGAIGSAKSYSSSQDATFTLPATGTAGYTLISNTQMDKAEGNTKYGKCRRVIFEYSGNKTIKLTNNSTHPSYYTSKMTISLV